MTPGRVLVIFGLPGSGKTYLAKRLANELGATYIGSDVVRFQLISQPTYSEKEKNRVYREMIRRATLAQDQGWVVLDGTFHKERWRQEVIKKVRLPPLFINIVAKEPLVKSRLNVVRKDSDADYEVYQRIKSAFDKVKGVVPVLESSNENIDELLKAAYRYVNEKL